MAAIKMRKEVPDHSWQPTVLVNELYLELLKIKQLRPVDPANRGQKAAFFALAAQVMHCLLVRHTRPLKWKAEHVELPETMASGAAGVDRLIYLEDLLSTLSGFDPQLRIIVELKVFEQLSELEIAGRLNCSVRTVSRHWSFAKSWLQSKLYPEG